MSTDRAAEEEIKKKRKYKHKPEADFFVEWLFLIEKKILRDFLPENSYDSSYNEILSTIWKQREITLYYSHWIKTSQFDNSFLLIADGIFFCFFIYYLATFLSADP